MTFAGPFPQGISPWYVGQLFPGWTPQLLYDDSTPQKLHPLDLTGLTGAAITLLIQPVDSSGTPTGAPSNGVGTTTISDAVNGKVLYYVAATDAFVVTAGYYELQWKVVMAGNLPWFSDYFILQTKAIA